MQEREKHERRDWLIILLIILIGFLCILLAGGWALSLAPNWSLNTSMESYLDPNSDFLTLKPSGFFEPIDSSILTKPAWMDVFLTPGASFATRTPAPTSVKTTPIPSTPTQKPLITVSPTNTLIAPTFTRTNVPTPPTKTPTPKPLPSADLRIVKNDGVVTYTAGGSVTYRIKVSNPNGSASVVNATVTDNFSANANIANANWTCSGTGGGTCMANGSGNINDNTVDLPVGASVTYIVNVNISAGATGALINTASVGVPSGYTDPVAGNNSATDTDTLFVPVSADLQITKDDGSATYGAYNTNHTVIYTVVVSNNGPNAVTGAVVSDGRPSQVTTWQWVCTSQTNGANGCTPMLGNANFTDTVNLPSGASITYTVTANIAIGSTGNLINLASVAVPVGYADTDNTNDSAMDTDTLFVPSVDLQVTKTDGVPSYIAGGTVTYTITITNNGPDDVTNATVTDTFPMQITSASWTCSGTGTCAANGSGDINDSTVDLLAGQSVTYTANANISPAATGALSNTASVTVPAGYNDPNNLNDSATDTDSQASVDLQITKIDGVTTYVAGGSLTYTIIVTNNGPDDVINATVADTFPMQITSATWNCSGTGTCIAGPVSGNINDTTVDLLAGQSVTYTVNANISPAATGALSNTASVSVPSGYIDPNAANNSATDTDVQASINLQITKTDNVPTYTPGLSVTYIIDVTNTGPDNVIGATVIDAFPVVINAAWTCASAGGATCTAGPVSGNINDTVNIPVGGTLTYTVNASIASSATGNLSNTATVTASGYTGITTASDTDTDTPVFSSDLAITKTDNSTAYDASATKTYIIVVSNVGPSDVAGATVNDIFSTNANVASASWTCSTTGSATCTAGSGDINNVVNMPVGSTITYTVTATIVGAPSGNLTNSASVNVPAGTTDPIPGNNSASDPSPDALIVSLGTTDGNIGTGQDGTVETLPPGSSAVLTLSSPVTTGHAGADIIYYEEPQVPGILMDQVVLEISDGSNWYTILNWGDGLGDVGTNITIPLPPPNPTDCSGEPDNCQIDASFLVGGTGITIDIDSMPWIPAGMYLYIRITTPAADGDGTGVDGIYVVP